MKLERELHMARFTIGYRTVKTALGAAVSIFLAQLLQLDFYVSAGIITILCISITKRDSLKISGERIVACLIGLLYATLIFELIGYHAVSIAILFLLFIPTAVSVGAKKGIVTSAVLILHVYTVGEASAALWVNELALLGIGIGVALIMNLYMPNAERDLLWDQVKVEDCFRTIWKEYAKYLKEGDSSWDGKEITTASTLLSDGKSKALRNIDNHYLRYDDYFYHYFAMREKQFDVLESILPFISSLGDTVIQGEKMAEFMEELSEAVSPGNTAGYFLIRLDELREEIKEMPLPETREEFEVRSSLFYILHELDEYLTIKKMFKPDPKRTHNVSGKRLTRDLNKKNKNPDI